MTDYFWETVVTEHRRCVLPTPWPLGAAVGELHKVLHAVDNALGGRESDDRAWVIAEDGQVVVYFEEKKPDATPSGPRCARCANEARFWTPVDTVLLCASHAADEAASGAKIERLDPWEPGKPFRPPAPAAPDDDPPF
jgi:hypothetical protein